MAGGDDCELCERSRSLCCAVLTPRRTVRPVAQLHLGTPQDCLYFLSLGRDEPTGGVRSVGEVTQRRQQVMSRTAEGLSTAAPASGGGPREYHNRTLPLSLCEDSYA